MKKFIIDFTLAEKKKLWKAKLSLRKLESYSLQQILNTLHPNSTREQEIKKQFFSTNEKSANSFNAINGQLQGYNPFSGMSIKATMDNPAGKMLLDSPYIKNLSEPAATLNANLPFSLNAIKATELSHDGIISLSGLLDNYQSFNRPLAYLSTHGLLSNDNLFISGSGVISVRNNHENLGHLFIGHESTLPKSLLQQDGKLGSVLLPNNFPVASVFEKAYTSSVVETLTAANSFTMLAQNNLNSFKWDSIGKRVNLSAKAIGVVHGEFMKISAGYGEILDSINKKPNWIYETPQIAKLPALDYYVSSRILKIVSTEKSDSVSPENLDIELREENIDAISRYLPVVHKDLLDLWNGALQAIKSQNPDKIRHMITSLRELYTHVLHILAPDKAFAKWDVERKYYSDNRPTRRGRFLYLCRNLNGSNVPFAKLLETEISSTMAMIGLFQRGTHSIKPTFSPEELEFIKIKADTTLRTFLTIEFEINRK